MELCCPLATYRQDTFHFAHHSVHEYILNHANNMQSSPDEDVFQIREEMAHQEIVETLLSYLALEGIADTVNVDTVEYPLARYATENWCYHLSSSKCDDSFHLLYSDFVASPDRRSIWIARSLISGDRPFPLQHIVKLQKKVGSWSRQRPDAHDSSIEDLNDIQRALFRLDEMMLTSKANSSLPSVREISNFERSIIVRDIAREYTMAGQLDRGVQMFEAALAESAGSHTTLLPNACWLLNSLGILYDQQGKAELAENMQRKALNC